MSRTTEAVVTRMPGQVRLFVHQAQPKRRGLLDRLFRLDIWGHTLLGERVAADMATAYLILALVFVFEFSAWTLLFNYVFHRGEFVLDRWTFAALGSGLLWGSGTFAIDKGIMTTDLQRPGSWKWMGLGARALLILVAAWLTAQPLEQFVFGSFVDKRLKEEIVLEEAVAYVGRLETTRDEIISVRKSLPDDQISPAIKTRLVEAQKIRKEALDSRDEDLAAVEWSLKSLHAAEVRRDRLLAEMSGLTAPVPEELEQAHKEALAAVQNAKNRLAQAKGRVTTSNIKLTTAEREHGEAFAAYKEARGDATNVIDTSAKELESSADDMKRFIDVMRRARYGDPVITPSKEPLQWRRADLIDRMIVLRQLTLGQPPRWPAVDDAQKAKVIELLGPVTSTDETSGYVARIWWTLFLTAAAIPFLAIVFKFTMSAEMKAYYSVECQERAGNPEAVLQRRVLEP